MHSDEIGLILQAYQKLFQPLQGKESIYKNLKKMNFHEIIPNEL